VQQQLRSNPLNSHENKKARKLKKEQIKVDPGKHFLKKG
jgi:hypothetical protein